MDLFAKNDKSLKSTKDITNYEIKQIGSSGLLFNFEVDCTFIHGDKTTNLIKARFFENYEKNSCIAPDTAKYVCFEVPTNTTMDELAKGNVFEGLNQIGKFKYLMPKNYNNLGYIDKIGDRKISNI